MDVEANELLISTAGTGDVAKLSNWAPECELETRPFVTAEELGTGRIRRALQKTGPTLISIVSTDSGFAGQAGLPAAEGYWDEALTLISKVSAAAFEKKVLARAQAPGPSPFTGVLESTPDGGARAPEDARAAARSLLIEGSRVKPGPRSMFEPRPIDYFELDLAMKPIRRDASILVRHSAGQEALLFLSGSVKTSDSAFCQYAAQRDRDPSSSPQWAKQARKVFALEVWSESAAGAMRNASHIKPADGGPDGVFACNIPGPDGDRIALYGVTPQVIADEGARTKAFAWLAERAGGFLKP